MAQADIIARRRLAVSNMLLRQATIREITAELPNLGIVNPRTRSGYSLGTIHNDIVEIRKEWLERAQRNVATLQAELAAEIRLARRRAWATNDLAEVRRLIEAEAKLMGANAPQGVILDANVRHEQEPTLEEVVFLLQQAQAIDVPKTLLPSTDDD